MYEVARNLRAQEPHSWTWNLVPLLIVTVALTGLFLPQSDADADTLAAAAAQAPSQEAPSLVFALVPSPQPGEGEPEIRVADLPQSY